MNSTKVVAHDNRSYLYSGSQTTIRGEYSFIADMVRSESKIIDYGCGNGSLLSFLREKKNCSGVGIEISPSGVELAKEKDFQVHLGSIDQPLEKFEDDEFDYAICNVTIQMVMYPDVLIREMRRVARYQIISFPNFGYIKNRIDLLFHGRMPKPMLFGYDWYSTGHIHQLSVRDFLSFAEHEHFKVRDLKICSTAVHIPGLKSLVYRFPNLLAHTCIFLLERTED
jgi:methionine biosynthesis protein MetW